MTLTGSHAKANDAGNDSRHWRRGGSRVISGAFMFVQHNKSQHSQNTKQLWHP